MAYLQWYPIYINVRSTEYIPFVFFASNVTVSSLVLSFKNV